MESAICDLCHNNEFDVAISELYPVTIENKIESLPSNTVICHKCGHIYNTPRMDQKEIREYYTSIDRHNFEGGEFSSRKQNLYTTDIKFITDILGEGHDRTVLDVGCYSGMLLNMIAVQGWKPYGIEPSEESVLIAKKKFGLDIFCGMFEDYHPENSMQYSLIILGSILEHMNSPTKALLHANRLIKPDHGYLYIRVPNAEFEEFQSIGHFFSIEHVNMYSASLLNLFLKKTGFETIRITSQKNSQHILCLARKTKSLSEELKIEEIDQDLYPTMRQKLQVIVQNFNNERNRVNELLKKLWHPDKKKIAIYGAGTHTEFLLKYTHIKEADIICLIDSNPNLRNEVIFGFQVKSPDEIPVLDIDCIVISSKAFEDDIYASINDCGKEVIRLYK